MLRRPNNPGSAPPDPKHEGKSAPATNPANETERPQASPAKGNQESKGNQERDGNQEREGNQHRQPSQATENQAPKPKPVLPKKFAPISGTGAPARNIPAPGSSAERAAERQVTGSGTPPVGTPPAKPLSPTPLTQPASTPPPKTSPPPSPSPSQSTPPSLPTRTAPTEPSNRPQTQPTTTTTSSSKQSSHMETRIITSFQSTGRIGKSTLAQLLISWLQDGRIDWSGIDADHAHKTLSGWYPEQVKYKPFRDNSDLLPILNEVGSAPVQILDFPAQSTEPILAGVSQFRAPEVLAEKGAKMTMFIFASDERASMLSAAKIINTLGKDVDYVKVYNPARYTSGVFDHSKVGEMLAGAPSIHVPALTQYTLESLDEISKSARRPLTFTEALPQLDIANRKELETWNSVIFSQFDEITDVLLPSGVKPARQGQRLHAHSKSVTDNAFDL